MVEHRPGEGHAKGRTLEPRQIRAPDGSRSTEVQIYRTAVRLFFERGYHGTSLRAIANDVGIQMSSLYHYFPSKQDVLFTIMYRTMDDLVSSLQQAVAGIDDAVARMRAIVESHVEFHASRQQEALITDSELRALEPENRETIVEMRDNYERYVRSVVAEGVDQGVFRGQTTKITIFAIMSMCTGVATWYRQDGPLTASDIAQELATLALRMLMPPRRGHDRRPTDPSKQLSPPPGDKTPPSLHGGLYQ